MASTEQAPLLPTQAINDGGITPQNRTQQFGVGAFLVAYLTVLLDTVGFGIVLPVIPYYIIDFGGNSAVWLGVILSAFSFGQFIGTTVLGTLSDKFGRKPLLIVGLVGSTGFLIFTGFSKSLYMLLLSRGLAGFFAGTISICQAFLTDATTPESRTKYMGLLGACIGLGFVTGPAVGSLLIQLKLNFEMISFVSAGMSGFNLLFALIFFRESLKKDSLSSKGALRDALHTIKEEPTLLLLFMVLFLYNFVFVGMETTLPLLLDKNYGITSKWLGIIFTGVGAIVIFVNIFVHPLGRKIGEKPLALFGLFLVAGSMSAIPVMPSLTFTLVAVGFLSAGIALIQPTTSALLSFYARSTNTGAITGMGRSCSALARGVSPIASGALFALHNVQKEYRGFLMYVIGGGLALICLFLCIFVKNMKKEIK